MRIGRKITGWINVSVQHAQSTEPYYVTRMYVHRRKKSEIKDEIKSLLRQSGDTLAFIKTLTIKIEKS